MTSTRGRHRPGPRRRVPGAARPVRRRRHGAGTARARQRAVRRPRRAGVGGRHGQGGDEGDVRRARAAGRAPWHALRPRRVGARPRRRRSTSSRALGLPLFVKPANLGSSVGISKVKTQAELRPAIETRARVRPQGRGRSRRCPRRARSNAPCSATTIRRPRCPARSSRRASSTTTRRSISTKDRRRVIPADLAAGSGRRGPAARDRGVPRHRCRRHGARRLPAVAHERRDLCSTRSTPSRASPPSACTRRCGRPAASPTGAGRSPDPARARAPRREAAAADERDVMRAPAGPARGSCLSSSVASSLDARQRGITAAPRRWRGPTTPSSTPTSTASPARCLHLPARAARDLSRPRGLEPVVADPARPGQPRPRCRLH